MVIDTPKEIITNQEAKRIQRIMKDEFGKKVSFSWNRDSSKLILEVLT